MDQQQTTFNDLPVLMGKMLSKLERVEEMLDSVREDLDKTLAKNSDEHIPMTLAEACEFLRMKPSTMYYHLERGNIPATHQGKNYILYKDELLRWTEKGRTIQRKELTPEEMNESFLKQHKRKPNRKI